MNRVIIAIAIVIFLIIIYWLSRCSKLHIDAEQYFGGFWVGDPVFCEKAGIESIVVLIDPSTQHSGRQAFRTGYVYSPQLCDQSFDLNYKITKQARDSFELELNGSIMSGMSGAMHCKINIPTGTLTITQDKKVLLRAFKNYKMNAAIL